MKNKYNVVKIALMAIFGIVLMSCNIAATDNGANASSEYSASEIRRFADETGFSVDEIKEILRLENEPSGSRAIDIVAREKDELKDLNKDCTFGVDFNITDFEPFKAYVAANPQNLHLDIPKGDWKAEQRKDILRGYLGFKFGVNTYNINLTNPITIDLMMGFYWGRVIS